MCSKLAMKTYIKGALLGLRQFLLTESPLKMMENAFYFIVKALFVLKVRKIRLISKFMTLQSAKQTIATQILPNISRIKGNQTMKFGHLIECDIKIFLEKLYTKYGRENISRPFSKISKLSIALHH